MAFGNIGEMYLSGVNNTNTYKLDSLSNIIWTKSLSGGVYGMVKNIDGSTYFTGAFQGAFDFDPSSAVYYLSSTGTEADIFVVKLDSQDNFEWAKKVGGGGYDCGINVNTDANGDVYVTGNFKSTVDFDPGPDSYIMTSFGEEDMFVLKLNKQGGFMSAKQFGSPRREYTSNATINSNGELFVVGYFEDTCDFDPGGQVYDIASNGDNDAFVLKLSSTLELKTLGTQCGPLTIFPNPTHQAAYVRSSGNIDKLVVTDIVGRVVQNHDYSNRQEVALDIATPGIYFITVFSGNNVTTEKLIVN